MALMMVKKGLNSLTPEQRSKTPGINIDMIDMGGKISEFSKYGRDGKVDLYHGLGWNWREEWLEPADDNEAWFQQMKRGQNE